ncbi:MAG: hypothetical protein WBO23_16890 [Burkholderiales bacterium]
MNSHELAELTTGLASRVNNLAVLTTGDACRELLAQQDELAKLAMAAIVKDLAAERANYQRAIAALTEASDFLGNADKKIANVAKAIELVAKAIGAVGKALA